MTERCHLSFTDQRRLSNVVVIQAAVYRPTDRQTDIRRDI